MLTFGSIASGIGGFDLGFERAGMICKWQIEIDDYRRKILAQHWPHVKQYADAKRYKEYNLQTVDLIVGGIPCQPYSVAGKRRGPKDDRNLWPTMHSIIESLRPDWVVFENVPGIINVYLDVVLSDLESMDYSTGTICVPALAFGASHIRQRIITVARSQQPIMENTTGTRLEKRTEIHGTATTRTPRTSSRELRVERERRRTQWPTEPRMARVAHGIPNRVDRVKGLGVSFPPIVAEWLGLMIIEQEMQNDHKRTMQNIQIPDGYGPMGSPYHARQTLPERTL